MQFSTALLVSVVPTVGLCSLTAAQEVGGVHKPPGPHNDMAVSFRDGRLTTRIQGVPLTVVLEEIARRTRVVFAPADALGDDLVSATVSDMPLDEALRRLLKGYDLFFYYGVVENTPSTLRAVWIYAKGTAAALRPVPPEAWAGTGELQASLTDSIPTIRERAYEALMERPSERSRELILGAIRGATEQDSGMRQRLLSNAISKGMELPPDLLADLARGDGSEEIRVMALEALVTTAPHAAAKEAAEAALYDPSRTVRERAADILVQLRRPQ